MADSSNPYGSSPNPSDVSYTPSSYTPPAPIYNSPAADTSAPFVPASTIGPSAPSSPSTTGAKSPSPVVQSPTAGSTPPPPSSTGVNWADVFNPPWMGQQSQQWLSFMMGPQGVQFQNQLAQQQEDLQKQIQTAAYTGDWNGVQTLQSKLQDVQIQLAKNQADMNNAIGLGNLTGQYNGHATLQAQDIQNQLALQARGQDVSMAGIQAQLAQSPLVAWYTARGLPPPTSAIMTGPAAWNPTWDWTAQAPPDPLLGGANSPPTPKT